MTKNEIYWNETDKLRKRILSVTHSLSLKGLERVADALEDLGIDVRKERENAA